jgi:hypothetical protein
MNFSIFATLFDEKSLIFFSLFLDYWNFITIFAKEKTYNYGTRNDL